jgi:hypothetical protein
VSCEALRIAVEKACLSFSNVAFFDFAAAKRTVCVGVWDAVVDENEADSVWNFALSCDHKEGPHLDLHQFVVVRSAFFKLSVLFSSRLCSSGDRSGCKTATTPSRPTILGNESVTPNACW